MSAVEQYLAEHYWTEDDLQREVRADTAKRGPSIDRSATLDSGRGRPRIANTTATHTVATT